MAAVLANQAVRDETNPPLQAEQEAILERMHDLRATTLEAHRLRARCALAYNPEIKRNGEPGGYNNNQLEWLLVRDLVGGESV